MQVKSFGAGRRRSKGGNIGRLVVCGKYRDSLPKLGRRFADLGMGRGGTEGGPVDPGQSCRLAPSAFGGRVDAGGPVLKGNRAVQIKSS